MRLFLSRWMVWYDWYLIIIRSLSDMEGGCTHLHLKTCDFLWKANLPARENVSIKIASTLCENDYNAFITWHDQPRFHRHSLQCQIWQHWGSSTEAGVLNLGNGIRGAQAPTKRYKLHLCVIGLMEITLIYSNVCHNFLYLHDFGRR